MSTSATWLTALLFALVVVYLLAIGRGDKS
jgi:hypothetical protein